MSPKMTNFDFILPPSGGKTLRGFPWGKFFDRLNKPRLSCCQDSRGLLFLHFYSTRRFGCSINQAVWKGVHSATIAGTRIGTARERTTPEVKE